MTHTIVLRKSRDSPLCWMQRSSPIMLGIKCLHQMLGLSFSLTGRLIYFGPILARVMPLSFSHNNCNYKSCWVEVSWLAESQHKETQMLQKVPNVRDHLVMLVWGNVYPDMFWWPNATGRFWTNLIGNAKPDIGRWWSSGWSGQSGFCWLVCLAWLVPLGLMVGGEWMSLGLKLGNVMKFKLY